MAARAQHQLIPIADAERWQTALQHFPAAPALDWMYASALQNSVGDSIVLYHYRSEWAELVCPLLLRQTVTCDIATPYGMGLLASEQPDASFATSFQRFALEQQWTTGYFACDGSFRPELWGLKAATVIPVLSMPLGTDEALLAGMQTNARYELRKWLASPPTLSFDQAGMLPWLLAEIPGFLRRVDAAPVYHLSAETLRQLLQSRICLAVAAVVEGHIKAVSLFLYKGETAEYFLNVSSVDGRHHTRGLIWHAARELRERGVKRLNLGGGIHGEDNLFAFKRRLGGEPVALPVLKQVFDSEHYEAACRAAGCLPGSGGFFPPYLQPFSR